MPSYYYHIIFQLNTLDSAICTQYLLNHPNNTAETYFYPPPSTDIFATQQLPDHTFQSLKRAANPKSQANTLGRQDNKHIRAGSLGANLDEGLSARLKKEAQAARAKSKRAAPVPPTPSISKRQNFLLPTARGVATPKVTAISNHLDYRFSLVSVESIDIRPTKMEVIRHRARGKSVNFVDQITIEARATKARFEPIQSKVTDFGYGVVHLYRDLYETSDLKSGAPKATAVAVSDGLRSISEISGSSSAKGLEEDLTIVAALAVPSYMTPSDLLGFVGEETRENVSHFRLIRTGESSRRYMVLMKFRNEDSAKLFVKEYNGRVFNSMEPENCHVVFVKSIQFQTSEDTAPSGGLPQMQGALQHPSAYPDISNDPFSPLATPAPIEKPLVIDTDPPPPYQSTSTSLSSPISTKPAPPPTANLLELPTCPVCLERMDETTGLLTIQCQHVFHCDCLTKWKDGSCPVCRYSSNGGMGFGGAGRSLRVGEDEDDDEVDMCNMCGAMANLWICLICGNIGCGRYDEKHAYDHYLQTSHCFAMDVESQRVWDYASDTYVHRLIQNKSDGKLVELPSNSSIGHDEDGDLVPRQKLENIGMEYTYLLTSQLDSQRMYFEEQVLASADKAAVAARRAEEAAEQLDKAMGELSFLRNKVEELTTEVVPSLEKGQQKAETKAGKTGELYRKALNDWKEEKAVSGGLMEKLEANSKEVEQAKKENEELKEQLRDLMFFVEGREKLKEMEEEGIEDGAVTVADAPTPSSSKKKKARGKAKK